MINRKAFTIIELLIVIGIISILAISLIVLLNPVDAQRRARDATRLRDISAIETIVKQAIDDGVDLATTCVPYADLASAGEQVCNSGGEAGAPLSGTTCTSSWISNADLCGYANSIPEDPLNAIAQCADSGGTAVDDCEIYYYVAVSGIDYEVGARMESQGGNGARLGTDNGNSTEWFEVGSDRALVGDEIEL